MLSILDPWFVVQALILGALWKVPHIKYVLHKPLFDSPHINAVWVCGGPFRSDSFDFKPNVVSSYHQPLMRFYWITSAIDMFAKVHGLNWTIIDTEIFAIYSYSMNSMNCVRCSYTRNRSAYLCLGCLDVGGPCKLNFSIRVATYYYYI